MIPLRRIGVLQTRLVLRREHPLPRDDLRVDRRPVVGRQPRRGVL